MFGKIIIYILFFMSAVTSGIFFLSYKKEGEKLLLARKMFYGILAGIIIVSVYFMINIFAHNFQFTYIFEYSSKELPAYLLFSSFYAGQEGSFLLWLFLFAIFGFFVIRYAKQHGYESMVMGLYCMLIAMILLIIVVKSPFDYIWDTYKDNKLEVGFMPANGKGLNPVLENPWITIHPPILFAGYAAAAIPFVFAIAGLIQRDYKKWIEITLPWTIIASALLGLGISLGGFWAYETLGWGGFWGWDPVENSSLLPWLCTMALIHTMIVQRKTNGLVKTNFVIAIVTFILVLYATFLTRSGILGDSSVHSFTDPGNTVYFLLVAILIVFVLISVFTFLMRNSDIKSSHINFNASSREFMLTFGSIFLLLSTAIILIGTSWPILSEMFGMKKSSVETSLYNNWNLPIMFFVLLTNGFSLFLNWKSSSIKNVFKKSLIAIILTIVALIIFVFTGVNEFKYILLLAAVMYSFFVNAEFAVRNLKSHPLKLGGYLSHIGVSLLMIGVVATGGYSKSELVNLKKGVVFKVLGYNLSLIDKIEIEKEKTDRQKFIYRINIEKNGSSTIVDPIVYWSDFNERKSPIIEPGIKRDLAKDIYITLKSSEVKSNLKTVSAQKGVTTNFLIDSSITFHVSGYDMSHSGMQDETKAKLGVVVNYNIKGKVITDTLYTKLGSSSVYKDIVWKEVPGTNIDIAFSHFMPSHEDIAKSECVFAFKPFNEQYKEPEEILTFELSIKPFINFVWLGVILITIGLIISYFNQRKLKNI
ncbi:MAG: cytochrome c biogenesis protein CcsA, partial [Bacteroidetes bacterium]|nr:cytochrome c biogenesis protein CcsA [Bacteroidota bacterium]